MLRVLIISLFVANLLLFGFRDNKPEVQQRPAKATIADHSNVPTIHLFSEIMEDQGLLSDNRQCFSLGPFHSIDDKDDVYASLLEVSVNTQERKTQALVEQGYWAYLPPYGSLLEANEMLLSLQAQGMKDIAVIHNGEWTNAISLGYFRRQENAVRRKKSLEDRGYSPLIRVKRQAEDRYWLDYEQNPGSDVIALDMQNRPNDFMQRSLPCPEQEVAETPAEVLAEQFTSLVQAPVQQPEEVATQEEGNDTPEEQGDGSPPIELDDQPTEQNNGSSHDELVDQASEEIIEAAPIELEPIVIDPIEEDEPEIGSESDDG